MSTKLKNKIFSKIILTKIRRNCSNKKKKIRNKKKYYLNNKYIHFAKKKYCFQYKNFHSITQAYNQIK
jgi:hypothetical protein